MFKSGCVWKRLARILPREITSKVIALFYEGFWKRLQRSHALKIADKNLLKETFPDLTQDMTSI